MNYKKGKSLVIIGADKNGKGGVMFHESLITFAEAKRYDPLLKEKDFNKLLGIEVKKEPETKPDKK